MIVEVSLEVGDSVLDLLLVFVDVLVLLDVGVVEIDSVELEVELNEFVGVSEIEEVIDGDTPMEMDDVGVSVVVGEIVGLKVFELVGVKVFVAEDELVSLLDSVELDVEVSDFVEVSEQVEVYELLEVSEEVTDGDEVVVEVEVCEVDAPRVTD